MVDLLCLKLLALQGEDALLVFIKNPEAGKVKTRLARSVGAESALAIYRALLTHTRQTALTLPVRRLLFYSSFVDQQDDWPADHFEKHLQQGYDLGARMDQAFRLALANASRAVLIGSDCASLTPAIIRQAFSRLRSYDYVLGPALDGGYYLIGMRRPSPTLFTGIRWSTSTVLQETLTKIEKLGKRYFLLPALSDIDTLEDWQEYGWKL